jgi:FkbH-like protein
MRLRRSSFVHHIPVGPHGVLLLHAVSQVRLKVDTEVDTLVQYFSEWQVLPDAYAEISRCCPYDQTTLATCVKALIDRGFLTEKSADVELADLESKLGATYGRDPVELLDHYRRQLKEGSKPYWTAVTTQHLRDLGRPKQRFDVVLLGDCDVHMEADFLRREISERGIDLRVAATSPDDFSFLEEHKHDAVIIGALYARHFITRDPEPGHEPHTAYIAQARHILSQLRAKTMAPILIDNLPEPTVQPMGLAERGIAGHRTRFRRANIALVELAEQFPDVYVTDIAFALNAEGSVPLIDDWQVGFTHMGSPGWMLQRPESEKTAVHNIVPDMTALAAMVEGDPYRREAVAARAHSAMLVAVLGIDRKKCVIVDLDDTLWPGVLAETGTPFAWEPSISGVFSFVGLYFGLHEALLCLKKRGIVLACISKNDEATVRQLWTYPASYPRQRLLTLDDFVTTRINWNDKVDNIRSIADELGFALDSFLFIDDNPVERDRVRQRLPQVDVWGENKLGLRQALLSDPRLQITHVTDESAARTELVKAQLDRQRSHAAAVDENAYLASLQLRVTIELVTVDAKLNRIEELFRRTTQFNATGRIFSIAELKNLIQDPNAYLFALHVSDRFGDHGLTGAAVIEGHEITGLVMSCRVLGMGVEHAFIRRILETFRGARGGITARINPTARNIPVRNIYRDNGFRLRDDGTWRWDREEHRKQA